MALQDILDSLNLLAKKEVQGKMTRKSGKVLVVNPDSTYDVEVDNVSIPRVPAERREEKYQEGESVVISYTYGECHMYQISGRSSYAIPEAHRHEFSSKPSTFTFLLSLDATQKTLSKFSLSGEKYNKIPLSYTANYISSSNRCIYTMSETGFIAKYKATGELLNYFDSGISADAFSEHPSKNVVYTVDNDEHLKRIDLDTLTVSTLKSISGAMIYGVTTNLRGIYISYFLDESYFLSKLDYAGNILRTISMDEPGFILVSGPQNNIYATSYSTVFKYTSSLENLGNFAATAVAIAVDSSGNIYGFLNTGGYSPDYWIYKYNSAGEEILNWDIPDDNEETICIL